MFHKSPLSADQQGRKKKRATVIMALVLDSLRRIDICSSRLPLYVTTVQTFSFSFQGVLTKVLHQLFRSDRHFYTQSPIFRGSKVIGQLTSNPFFLDM